MSQNTPEFNFAVPEDSLLSYVQQSTGEVRNLARVMAITGMAFGQRAWHDELRGLGFGEDETGERLTGVRINDAMKLLRQKGIVEIAEDRRLSGVWIKPALVVSILKDWAQADRKEMRDATKYRLRRHTEKFRSKNTRFSFHGRTLEEAYSELGLCYGYSLTQQWEELEVFLLQSDNEDLHHAIASFLIDESGMDVVHEFSDSFVPFFTDIVYEQAIWNLKDSEGLLKILGETNTFSSMRNRAEVEILCGNFTVAEEIAARMADQSSSQARASSSAIRGWIAFLKGENHVAAKEYEQSMAALVEGTRKKKAYPGGFSSVFVLIGMVLTKEHFSATKLKRFLAWGCELGDDIANPSLDLVNEISRMSEITDDVAIERFAENLLYRFASYRGEPIEELLLLLAVQWLVPELLATNEEKILPAIEASVKQAGKGGYRWVEMEYSEVLSRVCSDASVSGEAAARANEIRANLDFPPVALVDLVKPVPAWEKSIIRLESLFASEEKPDRGATVADRGERQLIWGLSSSYYTRDLYILPYERRVLKSGKWSASKKIALSRLFDQYLEWSWLPDIDRKIIESFEKVRETRWRGYNPDEEVTRVSRVISDLSGHPRVFWNDGRPDLERPIRIVEIEPTISLTEDPNGSLAIEIFPFSETFEAGGRFIQLLDNDILEHCVVSRTLKNLCETFASPQARKFPAEAKERVSTVLGSLSGSIRVEGDASATTSEGTREIAANETLYLKMIPLGDGLMITANIRPLGGDGPEFRPGQGGEVVFGHDEAGPIRAVREIKSENSRLAELISSSTTLAAHVGEFSSVWNLDGLETSLNVLLDLHEIPEEIRPEVEWPEGQALTLKGLAGAESFSMSLSSRSDWLEASGELRVDGETVMTMQNLLRLMEESVSSRFIRLEDGQYLALTERLRRQIEDIGSLSVAESKGEADSFRVPTLTAHLVEELATEAKTKTNTGWKKRIKKLEEAATLPVEIPSTLQAELRPYQREGFEWLVRLSHWTGGACLADDMGLGKTVQALALLLRRASNGPALIVAPVSVAANWADETLRFAPTLNVKMFRGPNRNELLDNLGPRDLVITTYGLLQNETEQFSEIEWDTVVVDEAQAIKNRETLRYKAAIKLRAEFRLITTGTPIENHLQELYNLFHFIQPGLLGSLTQFQQKFAVPIEQRHDEKSRDRLRRLIRPFILRRLKSEVLRDLPEKTEITLRVELSEEETVFYEAIRRNAVEMIDSHAEEKGAVRILAELMKLRRACCNPALIDPKNAPASSKLKVFRDTLDELLSNGHKVLVFSQFVDHLGLLREHLDEEQITYQYLDGSTTPKKRKSAIDAFQSGDGDVFLISLKAGGFGLNLTAADYVIHMDPWWNPAVEDQASDRAHRIGQKRPVTIYRMVASGTIEEKIVALHHQKRELADSLLTGTDSATKLSVDQLKALLTEDD